MCLDFYHPVARARAIASWRFRRGSDERRALWSDTGVWDFEIDGRPAPAAGAMAWNAGVTVVTPGFFETLGMRLIRGRFFSETDGPRAMTVTAINETMAARFFPGEDPIGKRSA